MNPTVSLEPACEVPDCATVRDYDELGRRAKQRLPAMVAAGRVAVDAETAAAFTDGEYLNYVGYYRVAVAE